MRVALIHDWLTGFRGGEKVLHEIVGLFPHADLYTLIHVPGTTSEQIEALPIHTSFLSRLPGVARHYRKLLPLYPWAIERFDLSNYELVISCSHSFAKGVRVAPGTPHLCYCSTPIRYVWDHVDTYLGRGLKRALAAPLVTYLRRWDRRTSTEERITKILANSRYIADRIRRAWGREATVVHPCVDVERFQPATEPPDEYYLLVGGFVPYKAEDLAIEAFGRLGLPLLVAGDGPTRAKLQAGAPSNVRFLGRVPDAQLERLYARCRALIYPQEEDFGIIAVEAQACGRPVVAFGRGGAAETVVPLDNAEQRAPTGVFFREPSTDALQSAVQQLRAAESSFDPREIRKHAERFSNRCFRERLQNEISALVGSRI